MHEEEACSRFVDYTNATDFEQFISDLENALRAWKVDHNGGVHSVIRPDLHPDGTGGNLDRYPLVQLTFGAHNLRLRLISTTGSYTDMYTKDEKGNNSLNCHFHPLRTLSSSAVPPLDSWLGITTYLLLSRVEETSDYLGEIDEGDGTLFLSALTLAMAQCQCTLPGLVSLREPSHKAFRGTVVPSGGAVHASVYLETDIVSQMHTQGVSSLLDFFRMKMKITPRREQPAGPDILVAATLSYEWISPKHSMPLCQKHQDGRLLRLHALGTFSSTHILPLYGPKVHSLQFLTLHTSWDDLQEGSYVDNAVHSSLVAQKAPFWRILPTFIPLRLSSPSELALSYRLHRMLKALKQVKDIVNTTQCYVVDMAKSDDASSSSVAGDLIGRTVHTSLQSTKQQHKAQDTSCIQAFLQGCFDTPQGGFPGKNARVLGHGVPVGELVSVVAMRCCELHSVSSICALWVSVVKALRQCWDAQLPIPCQALLAPLPNLGCSLLQQKMEMLQYCIIYPTGTRTSSSSESDEDKSEENVSLEEEEPLLQDNEQYFDGQPSFGRAGLLPFMGLRSAKALYIPVTQNAAPVTEDDLVEQQHILLSLDGASLDSQRIRHTLLHNPLISDMQAFKAANPECILADFIRWHSPSDFKAWSELTLVEQEQYTGRASSSSLHDFSDSSTSSWLFVSVGILSERMQDTSNVWHANWSMATPCSVSTQSSLLDASLQAEKVFHFLETLSPIDLFHQLLVATLSNSIAILSEAVRILDFEMLTTSYQSIVPLAEHTIVALDAAAASSTDEPTHRQVAWSMAVERCEQVLTHMCDLEAAIVHAEELQPLLPASVVERILARQFPHALGTILLQAEREEVIHALDAVKEENEGLLEAPPSCRQYILSCSSPRPFQSGMTSEMDVPHRMYAAFDQNTVRFALALSESEY